MYVHILTKPQRINENSKFNFCVAKTMVSSQCLLWKKGFIFTFIGCINDGVSCESAFVLSALTGFLREEINYTDLTDTNHNNALSRYKLVIGGKNDKTIGIYIIDIGLLNKEEIAHDLFIQADFSSD